MNHNFFKSTLFLACLLLLGVQVYGQNRSEQDSLMLRAIYDNSLLNGKSYKWLDYLSNEVGGRLSGSLEAEKAVEYTKKELEKLGLDKVWLQPVMVPKWTRGFPEYAFIETRGRWKFLSKEEIELFAMF